jgi:5-methylcytosine-specific restriction protein A
VAQAFLDRPEDMRAEAQAIEATFRAWDEDPTALPDPDLDDVGAHEGGAFLKAHLRRERNSTLRTRKIEQTKRRGLPIACEACGFDFFVTYGARGADYIECHHRTPLHVTGPVKTQTKDLALICSNCHRMIHRTRPWLTVEELRDIIRAQRESPRPIQQ